MPTFCISSLYHDRLSCLACGETVAAIDPAGDDPLGPLTAAQACAAWPELAGPILAHDLACRWRLDAEAPGADAGRAA